MNKTEQMGDVVQMKFYIHHITEGRVSAGLDSAVIAYNLLRALAKKAKDSKENFSVVVEG